MPAMCERYRQPEWAARMLITTGAMMRGVSRFSRGRGEAIRVVAMPTATSRASMSPLPWFRNVLWDV